MGRSPGLQAAQLGALARLTAAGLAEGLHLVGGSAIGLHLGHRTSMGLDLFSLAPGLDLAALQRRVAAMLPDARVLSRGEVTMRLVVGSVPVDIVDYQYRPLDPPGPGTGGVLVASLRDLAAMKLGAIACRGVRRDFWDLHEILTRSPIRLDAALADYQRKFGRAESDLYHVLRSLTWFEDAEAATTDAWPEGLRPAHWETIKDWLLREVPGAARRVPVPG